jgi:hypothetical protein
MDRIRKGKIDLKTGKFVPEHKYAGQIPHHIQKAWDDKLWMYFTKFTETDVETNFEGFMEIFREGLYYNRIIPSN